jgi:hypothetical protein
MCHEYRHSGSTGLLHPIEEVQRVMQNLRDRRVRIARLPNTDRSRELLSRIEAVIAARNEMIQQATLGGSTFDAILQDP